METKLSLETCGHHNAIVAYPGNGSRIIIVEDNPHCTSKERAAYCHLEKLVRSHSDLLKALDLIAKSKSFKGGTFVLELQQIAKSAVAKAKGQP